MTAEELKTITIKAKENQKQKDLDWLRSNLIKFAGEGIGFCYVSKDRCLQGPFGPTLRVTSEDLISLASEGFKLTRDFEMVVGKDRPDIECYKVSWYDS